MPGRVAQSAGHLTRKSGVLRFDTRSGHILSFLLPLSQEGQLSVTGESMCTVNRLGGLSLPRKSVVRLTDRPDMTLDVYRGRKTTIQQHIAVCSVTTFWDSKIRNGADLAFMKQNGLVRAMSANMCRKSLVQLSMLSRSVFFRNNKSWYF